MASRRRRPAARFATLFVLATLVAAIAAPSAASAASFSIQLDRLATGLQPLTQVTNAGDGTDRLFLVERRGTIRVFENGDVRSGYFMDIRSRVADGGERGLLGLAFHPSFETNRYLYVFFTRNDGDIIVARYRTNVARTNVDESTYRPILRIEHSRYTNHNGGSLVFGPDNMLYISTGDGGGSGDPGNNAQDKGSLLGKILRINVNGTGDGPYDRYDVPGSNPFAGRTPGRGEIWAYGLRNPWRISFDRGSGRLFIADVGQSRREEINTERAGFTGGRNYGWRVMEGSLCFRPASGCSLRGDRLPVEEYSHGTRNCSITGGHVYRGPSQTAMVGQYVFADFCSGRIWTLPWNGEDRTLRADTAVNITSFGESEDGELYAVTIDGGLYQVLAS